MAAPLCGWEEQDFRPEKTEGKGANGSTRAQLGLGSSQTQGALRDVFQLNSRKENC